MLPNLNINISVSFSHENSEKSSVLGKILSLHKSQASKLPLVEEQKHLAAIKQTEDRLHEIKEQIKRRKSKTCKIS